MRNGSPNKAKASVLRRAMAGAAATFALGFGAMSTFWFLGPKDSSLRGFHEYRSATVGDGLALPLVAFGLVGAYASVKPSRWKVPTAILGAVLGAATQASWLIDPNPELNWTIPEPHTFNGAGWYHAGFMVVGGFVSGWLIGAVVPNIRESANRQKLRGWLTLSTAGAMFFIYTLASDNIDILHNPSSTASLLLAALGGTVAAGTLVAVWRP